MQALHDLQYNGVHAQGERHPNRPLVRAKLPVAGNTEPTANLACRGRTHLHFKARTNAGKVLDCVE